VKKKPEGNKNIQLRLMVRHNHIRRIFPNILAPLNANPPGRHHPCIKRTPKAGKQIQEPQTPVKGIRKQAQKQGNEK
jgi:hypothetical protein